MFKLQNDTMTQRYLPQIKCVCPYCKKGARKQRIFKDGKFWKLFCDCSLSAGKIIVDQTKREIKLLKNKPKSILVPGKESAD